VRSLIYICTFLRNLSLNWQILQNFIKAASVV